jgi:hypothetical protein
MRCYFHLSDGHSLISDDEGIEVADLDEARSEAMKAIEEFRAEAAAAEHRTGWRMDITDESGTIFLSIDLDQ